MVPIGFFRNFGLFKQSPDGLENGHMGFFELGEIVLEFLFDFAQTDMGPIATR
jgi:hypothetical protein